VKRLDVRKAEQKGDLGERILGVADIRQRELPADRVDLVRKRRTLLLELAAQGASAHTQ